VPFGDPVPEKVDDVESVGEAVDGLDTQHLDPPPAAHDQRVNDQPQGESAGEPDGVPRPYPLREEPGHGDGGQRDDQRTERGADVVQEPRPKGEPRGQRHVRGGMEAAGGQHSHGPFALAVLLGDEAIGAVLIIASSKRGQGTPGDGAGVQTPSLRPVQPETRSPEKRGKLNPSASRGVSAHGGRSCDPRRVRQESNPRSGASGTLATASGVTNTEGLMLARANAASIRMSRPVRRLQGATYCWSGDDGVDRLFQRAGLGR
jgi:hypothetical protein